MSREYQTGAINPYALAELVAGKAIKWEKYPDQTQALCEILNISRADLFTADSPILTPYTQILPDGTEKELTYDEAKKRLDDFLARRTTRRITQKPPMRKLRLKTIRQRIPGIVLPAKPEPLPDIIFPIKPEPLPKHPDPFPPTVHEKPSLQRPRPHPVPDEPWMPEGYAWQDMGEYFKEVPEFDDPMQGVLGDCYFIAALSAVVWTRPYAIANHAKASAYGNEDSPLHRLTFYRNGKAETVEVSEKAAVRVVGGGYQWAFARSRDAKEIWPAVLEKAYAVWRTKTKTDRPDMLTLTDGNPGEACMALVGGKMSTYLHSDVSSSDVLRNITENCEGKRAINPMFASSLLDDHEGCDCNAAKITHRHSYSILGWDERGGRKYVVLRNPWGYHEAVLDVLSGTWACDGDTAAARVPYGKNGVFAIRADTFHRYFRRTIIVTGTKN